ncbi:MAG: hypothetical protein JW939_04345 [Candidatus Thermoplasmatota archaeon]|nr:hypothetical protein [Candidatus Thermoplasmatota archaeon]
MTKYAVVFVGDPHCDPPLTWSDEEYEKANRFIEALIAWGYPENQILVVGDETRFYHGDHRGECETDNSTATGAVDNLGPVLTEIQEDVPFTDKNIDRYCLWISDNCPLIGSEPKLRIQQHNNQNKTNKFVEHDATDGSTTYQIITAHLNAMKDKLCRMTVIFSGMGSGNIASRLNETINTPNITMIASSPGDNDYDAGDIDHFNIGIVMPQVTEDDFKGTDGAYWAEVARLNGLQSPLMWPSQD